MSDKKMVKKLNHDSKKGTTLALKDMISKKMDEFIEKVDSLCWEYGYQIWATDKINKRNDDGSHPTFTIHGDGEKVSLMYIDGDGRGK